MADTRLSQYLNGTAFASMPAQQQPASQAVPSSAKQADVESAVDRITSNFAATGNFPTLDGEILRIQDQKAQRATAVSDFEKAGGTGYLQNANLESADPWTRYPSRLANIAQGVADGINKLNVSAGNAGNFTRNLISDALVPQSDADAFQRSQDRNASVQANLQNATALKGMAAFEGQPGAYDDQAQAQAIQAAATPQISEADQATLGRTIRPFNYMAQGGLGQTTVGAALSKLAGNPGEGEAAPANIANPLFVDRASKEAEEAGKGKTGISKLASMSAAYLSNPLAVAQGMAESVPYMVGGIPGMIASSGLYGLDVAQQATRNLQKNDGSVLPSAANVATGLALGTVDAGLNFAEAGINRLGLVGRSVGRSALSPVTNALADTGASRAASRLAQAAASTPAGRIAATATAPVLNAAEHVATNAITEGLVSGAQNQIEQQYAKGKTDWDSQGNALAFAQGAATAAGFSAPGIARQGAVAARDAAANKVNAANSDSAKLSQTAQTNSFEDLTNPQSDSYNPAAAVRKQADVFRNPEATADDHKAATDAVVDYVGNLQQTLPIIKQYQDAHVEAQGVVDDAQNKLTQLQDEASTLSDPEAKLKNVSDVQSAKAELAAAQDKISQMPPVEALNTLSDQYTQALEQVQPELERFDRVSGQAKTDAQTKTENVDTLTQPEEATTPAQQTTAARDVTSYPMKYSPEQLRTIADNPPANMNESQVNVVRSVADAREAVSEIKDQKGVTRSIIKDSNGADLSLPDYLTNFATAVRTNNTKRQDQLSTAMTNFEQSHVQKADALREAFDAVKGQKGKTVQVYKDESGNWNVNPDKKVKAASSIDVHLNSNKSNGGLGLIDRVAKEAQAITATRKAMEAMQNVDASAQPTATANATQSSSPRTTADLSNLGFTPDQVSNMTDADAQRIYNPQAEASAETTNPQAKPEDAVVQAQADAPVINPTRPISNSEIRAMDEPTVQKHLATMQEAAMDNNNPTIRDNFNRLDSELTRRSDAAERMTQNIDRPNRNVVDNLNPTKQATQTVDEAVKQESKNTQNETVTNEENNDSAEPSVLTAEDTLDSNPLIASKVELSPKPEGQISTLASNEGRDAERAKPATKQNLLVSNFVQAVRKGSPNPLVMVKDFASSMLKPALASGQFTDINRMLASLVHKGHAASKAQVDLLKGFNTFNDKLRPLIEASLKAKQDVTTQRGNNYADFKYQDLMQFMMTDNNGKTDLDENVKTAIAAAAFSHIAENASGSMYKSRKQFAAQFGIQDEASVPTSLYNRLSDAGDNAQALAQDIGRKAYQMLGFKLADNKVDPNQANKLQVALGAYTLRAMEDAGLMERTTISKAELFGLTNSNVDANTYVRNFIDEAKANNGNLPASRDTLPNPAKVDRALQTELRGILSAKPTSSAGASTAPVSYVRFKSEVNPETGLLKPSAEVAAIPALSKGTEGLLSKLFSFEPNKTDPSLVAPKEHRTNTFGDFNQEIPSEAKDRLNKMDRQANGINEPIHKAFQNALASNYAGQFMRILGMKDLNSGDLAYAHKSIKKSQEAKNKQLETSVEDAMGFISRLTPDVNGRLQNFYLPTAMWSNQRVGIAANTMNPQANKVHRILSGLRAFDTVVDTTEGNFNTDGSPTRLGLAKAVIAQGMEEVPFGNYVDLGGRSKLPTIDKVNMSTYLPYFDQYVQQPHVQRAIQGMNALVEGTPSRTDMDAIETAVSEFGMGPQSLSALHSLSLIDKGGKATLSIGGESDGITNGPMITQLLFGTGDTELLAKGGMYTADAPYNDMIDYRNAQKGDLYETFGNAQKESLQGVLAESPNLVPVMNALNNLNPSFGNRSGAKPVVTKTNYGAGENSVRTATAEETETAMYKTISNIANRLGQGDKAGASEIAKKFMGNVRRATGDTTFTIPSDLEALQNFDIPRKTLSALYEAESQTRGEASVRALNNMFPEYQDTRSKMTVIAKAAFTLSEVLNNRKAQLALNAAVKDGSIPTTAAGNPISGLTVEQIRNLDKAQQSYQPVIESSMGAMSSNPGDSGYMAAKSGKTYGDVASRNEVKVEFAKGGSRTNFEAYPSTAGRTDPGVSMSAMVVQGTDANVATKVSANLPAYNFHDSNGMSIQHVVQGAQLQNKSLFEAVRDYNVGEAFENALVRTVKGVADSANARELTADDSKKIKSAMSDLARGLGLHPSTRPAQVMEAVSKFAMITDASKLKLMQQLTKYGQYGFEGGTYHVPQKDLNDLGKRHAALRASYQDRLAAARESVKGSQVLSPKAEAAPSNVTAMPEGKVRKTLSQVLSANEAGTTTIGDLMTLVSSHLPEGNKPSTVMAKELTSVIQQIVPKDLKVNLLNEFSNDSAVLDAPQNGNSRAWFMPTKTGGQINIRTEGVTPEVVLHEALHAATAHVLDAARQDPKKYPQATEALSNLETLLGHVQDKLKMDSTDTQNQFSHAIANVDELVSWGLTNPEFQHYLSQMTGLPMGNRNLSILPTGLRNFVTNVLNALHGFLGIKTNGKTITGLEALLMDSASVLAQANTTPYFDGASLQMANAANQVGKYTHKELFDSLGSSTNGSHNSPQFKARIGGLMQDVSDKLYSVIGGSQITGDSSTNYTPGQVWGEALTTGKAPFTTKALGAGFRMSDQEAFAIEAIETTVGHTLNSAFGTAEGRELRKAWEAARKNIKPEDFLTGSVANATATEKALAQKQWDHLFTIKDVGPADLNNYLAHFAAMGLGHEQTSNMLKFPANDAVTKGKHDYSNFEKVAGYFNHAVDWVSGRLSNTNVGENIDTKLPILIRQMTEIDLKNRDKSTDKLGATLESIQHGADKISDGLKAAAAKFGNAKGIADSSITPVRALAGISKLAGEGKMNQLTNVIQNMRDTVYPSKANGEIMSILNESTVPSKVRSAAERLNRLTGNIEQQRQRFAGSVTSTINEMFENKGKDLTQDDRTSLTYSLLRTDAHSLLNNYSFTDIHQFLTDAPARQKAMADMQKQVMTLPNGDVKVARAKALAYWMVKGIATHPAMALNAEAIARDSGLPLQADPQVDANKIEDIDSLVSLYAIHYSDQKHLNQAANVMGKELARGKDNGIGMLMGTHRALSTDAASTLFSSNPLSIQKGYTPEVTNPYHDVKIMSRAEAVESGLAALGYQEVSEVHPDPNVVGGTTRVMYVTKDSGYQRMVSGSMSFTGLQRKGSDAINGYTDAAGNDVSRAQAKQTAIKNVVDQVNQMNHATFNPETVKVNHMVPVLDTAGHIMDFRYTMEQSNRDTLLDRNNDFADLLGTYAGQSIDKQQSPKQNQVVLDAAYEDYSNNYKLNPDAYMHIGPQAATERGREIWAMLPQDSKQHAAQQWGDGNGMYIRNDLVNLTFGFRKYSLGEMFDKDQDQRNFVESMLTSTLEGILGVNAKAYTVKTQRGVHELMSLFKDIVVVRNVKTLVGNQISNSAILTAYGVSPVDNVKWSKEALQSGISYRKNMALILKYQAMQRAGVGDSNVLDQQILQVQDQINRNPLKEFIERGAMPTIVEDLSSDSGDYTYASSLKARVKPLTNAIPDPVKTLVRYATVAKDTPHYKFLHDATGFSDFMAKYVLYKHATEKARTKLDNDAAFQIASDAFVNYDIPSTRLRQFADDTGLMMFTKYRIRVQRAMFHLLGERPGSAMAQAVFMARFTNQESALSPFFMLNLGNPLKSSIFQMPGAILQPFPIQLVSAVM